MPITHAECLLALGTLAAGRLSGAPRNDQEAEDVARLFGQSFQDWDAGRLNAAVLAYLNSPDPAHRFWPTPGALRVALPQPDQQRHLTGEQLWPTVYSLLKSCGCGVEGEIRKPDGTTEQRHRSGYWKHRMIQMFGLDVMRRAWAALGRQQGYDAIGQSDERDQVAHRARFCNAWEGAGRQIEEQAQLARLEAMVGRPLGLTARPSLEVIEGGGAPLRPDRGWGGRAERFGVGR